MISKVEMSDAGKYACKIKIGQSFIKAGVVVNVLGMNLSIKIKRILRIFDYFYCKLR